MPGRTAAGRPSPLRTRRYRHLNATTRPSALSHALIALAWAAFVFYGSLVPLDYQPRANAWESFRNIRYLDLGIGSRADWVANILLYIVLAFYATGAVMLLRLGRILRVLLLGIVLALCFAMAVTIEFLQLFFPPRTVSLNDIIAEGLGTVIGCIVWLIWGERLARLWRAFLEGGRNSLRASLLLYAIAYAAFSLFPYDFLVSRAEFAEKFDSPAVFGFWNALGCRGAIECSVKIGFETLLTVPIGVLLAIGITARAAHRITPLTGLLAGALLGLLIEAIQLTLASGITQGLSVVTSAVGVAWGVILGHMIVAGEISHRPRPLRWLGLLAAPVYLALLLVLNRLLPFDPQPVWAALEQLDTVRFIPFYYHYYTSETEAVRSLLQVAGSMLPIGVLAALAFPAIPRRVRWLAVLSAVALAFGLEALKLFHPERRPDPTNLLITWVAVWLAHWVTTHILPWLAADPVGTPASMPSATAGRTTRARSLKRAAGAVATVIAITLVGANAPVQQQGRSGTGAALAAPAAPTYPPAAELPPVALPDFRHQRPRLPHPSMADLVRLAIDNPDYLAEQKSRAASERRPALDAMIFNAFAEPGSQDLDALTERLTTLPRRAALFGHILLLATAYDWLHYYWTEEQHARLQHLLGRACQTTIEHIRAERLSPYARELYAGPLQALMACSIALYQDHPQGELYMRFAHELWINRVLPVWDQVFGLNGGWHEGANLLADGIGRAIYSVPAMWRHGTGDDRFAKHPGLAGFLDFLVHRVRPDGTQFRWGDGAFFDRHPPEANALALEFGHAAAYSLSPPRGGPAPVLQPWGPLSDTTLAHEHTARLLPLSRLFDGLGKVVARSDWTPEATYVTFKAGDNYWSHTHLDQGAFTIYKGGPLAIDSGIKGPLYGSLHHRNYAYQTIAHNTITVTDPADTVPAPAWDGPRPFANDGGQRRIGSTPRINPAPLDRDDWEAQRDTYHTGRIAHYLEADGLTVALTDITPAYTNSRSGQGFFEHRTRRVERLWRTFGYDRVDDVVVIYDDVESTRPDFTKRWLLHSQEMPQLQGNRFRVEAPSARGSGRGGGRLEAVVLLPEHPIILPVGGPGMEFSVDGVSYQDLDRRGEPRRRTHRHIEPGAWRVEVMPPHPATQDVFLVVLLPTAADLRPTHSVRLVRAGAEIGAEVVGPRRSTTWWFTPGQHTARVVVEENGLSRTHMLRPERSE